MNIRMCPVTDIGSLCDSVNEQFGLGFDDYELCHLLFDDNYQNDCYKSFGFGEDAIYEGYSWQNPTTIELTNKVKQYLRERLPHDTRILIDVSW